jgi:hypothetical protein
MRSPNTLPCSADALPAVPVAGTARRAGACERAHCSAGGVGVGGGGARRWRGSNLQKVVRRLAGHPPWCTGAILM